MDIKNRRKLGRWGINIPAKIKLEGAVSYAPCRIMDINLSGMQVSLALKLPQDRFFKLSLFVADGCEVNAEAWVAWRKPVDGLYIYGIYFTATDEKSKGCIYKFVFKNFPEEISKADLERNAQKKGGEIMDDKRIFQRFNIRFPVKFLKLQDGTEGSGLTNDISAKGIGLRTEVELEPHTPVEVWLKLPDQGEPIYTRGEVAWSSSEGPKDFRSGINLDKADLMGLSRILRV